MKNKSYSLIALFMLSFAFGCSSKEESPEPQAIKPSTKPSGGGGGGGGGGGITESFTATIDGMPFTATTRTAVRSAGDKIDVTGQQGDKTIEITVPDNMSSGSFPLNSINALYVSGSDSYIATEGTCTITQKDMTNKVIAGTFNFKGQPLFGTGTVTITNGSFKIKWTE